MTCVGKTGEVDETCTLKQVEWKIEDFFCLSMDAGQWYRNDYFPFADEKWCLRVYAGGENEKSQGYISVYLQASKPFYSAECTMQYTFGFKKADGRLENILHELSYTFRKGEVGYGYSKFFRISELMKRKSDLLPSGVLTIVCTMRLGNLLTVIPQPCRLELREVGKLSQNLQSLLAEKKSCDVTLEVNGKSFEVHKSILMARSPVFAAMFEHKMSEKETGTVIIPDCDEQSFGLFLEYIYSGTVNDVSFDGALGLYPTAHKYDVPELKSFCLKYLEKNLTVEDVMDACILADKYDETDLMSAVQHFFNRNLNKIVLTENWETLMKHNFHLANRLIIAMSSNFQYQDEYADAGESVDPGETVDFEDRIDYDEYDDESEDSEDYFRY